MVTIGTHLIELKFVAENDIYEMIQNQLCQATRDLTLI